MLGLYAFLLLLAIINTGEIDACVPYRNANMWPLAFLGPSICIAGAAILMGSVEVESYMLSELHETMRKLKEYNIKILLALLLVGMPIWYVVLSFQSWYCCLNRWGKKPLYPYIPTECWNSGW